MTNDNRAFLTIDDIHRPEDETQSDIIMQKVINSYNSLKKDNGFYFKMRLHESKIDDFLSFLTWISENNKLNEIRKSQGSDNDENTHRL